MTEPAMNLLRCIMDSEWRTEPYHEKDCPACDFADEIVATIASCWDPNDTWHDTPIGDGLPGDTVFMQAVRCTAHVLHRRMLGVVPTLDQLRQRRADVQAVRDAAEPGGSP